MGKCHILRKFCNKIRCFQTNLHSWKYNLRDKFQVWTKGGWTRIKVKVTRLRGYRPVEFFSFKCLEGKGYEVTKVSGVMMTNKDEHEFFLKLWSTHLRLRGYRVSKVTWLQKILHISCHIYVGDPTSNNVWFVPASPVGLPPRLTSF